MQEPDRRDWGLLWIAFLESFGTILLERGLYFYTHDLLKFSDSENLWLALSFGVFYVAGAFGSHAVSAKLGEKRLLVTSVLSLLLVHTLLTFFPNAGFLVLAFPVVGLLQGIKWPVVESYVAAGRTPKQLVASLARFNIAWALAVPPAVASSGLFAESTFPGSLFAAAALLNLGALALSRPLRARPLHLDRAHPERPEPGEMERLGALLRSARFSLLASYALLFLLAPLMPTVFDRLGLEVSRASAAASLLDAARVVAFYTLGAWTAWRGRALPLMLSVALLPVGFLLSLFGQTLSLVLVGELIFGAVSGYVYTAALYYALVVKNAAVDAGGVHESLIGLGFVLGPVMGLLAQASMAPLGSYLLAMLVCAVPFTLACAVGAVRALLAQ